MRRHSSVTPSLSVFWNHLCKPLYVFMSVTVKLLLWVCSFFFKGHRLHSSIFLPYACWWMLRLKMTKVGKINISLWAQSSGFRQILGSGWRHTGRCGHVVITDRRYGYRSGLCNRKSSLGAAVVCTVASQQEAPGFVSKQLLPPTVMKLGHYGSWERVHPPPPFNWRSGLRWMEAIKMKSV